MRRAMHFSLIGLSLSLGCLGISHAATFTVVTSSDAGAGSLRQALADAAATPGSHIIRFVSGVSNITLTSGQLNVPNGVTIDGDGNDDGTPDVTISAGNASRVMAVDSNATAEIKGLIIQDGNTGIGGGGIYIGSSSTVTLRNSTVQNNSDTGGGGGGIYGATATLNLINTLVRNNTSSSFGGGVRIVSTGGKLDIQGSTVVGNTTTGTGAHGGGVQFGGTSGLRVVNSTISGNGALGASSFGGGLRITSGTSEVIHSTIVGNASTASGGGGGVNASGNDTFINTLVAGNTSGAGAAPAVAGAFQATGGSADDVASTVETATASYFGSNVLITTNQGSFNNQGTGNVLLGALANNGGIQPTHLPTSASALRDAASCSASTTTDQRGIARPQGPLCDIGAVELVSFTTSVSVTGSGKVDSSPAGISNCTPSGGTCALGSMPGEPAITLTATPNAGHDFVQWGGACASAGSSSTCNLPAATAQSATALFTRTIATQSTTGGTVNLQIAGSSCVFSTTNNGSAPSPAGYNLPYGQIGFRATGCSPGGATTVTLTFPASLPAGATLLKYTGSTWVTWTTAPAGANSLTFTVTDAQTAGAVGASTGDLNAAAGIIDDPVALAVPIPPGSATAIPTLQTWALLLTSILAMAGGGWYLRRRQDLSPH